MTTEASLLVDGRPVALQPGDERRPLLDVLRQRAGVKGPKGGCSPQGQCGCCTVLVDGEPRVACVTQTRRVLRRAITTIDGLDDAVHRAWTEAFAAAGASQCGFCTPGIITRLSALAPLTPEKVDAALAAHLCRCTGWQPIKEAAAAVAARRDPEVSSPPATVPNEPGADSDAEREGSPPRTTVPDAAATGGGGEWAAAARQAQLEGGVRQLVGPAVAAGHGGFAEDTAPDDALVAMRADDGRWVVADERPGDVAGARSRAGKVPGRKTTLAPTWPLSLPDPPAGEEWTVALQTTWVEPAYLETDATWCRPGGEPAAVNANGGAFGGKSVDVLGPVARRLADETGRPVRVLLTREDVARWTPKRPPVALGLRADGTGVIRVGRGTNPGLDGLPSLDTDAVVALVARVAPGVTVEVVDVPGPPTALTLRGAVWLELAAAAAVLAGPDADGYLWCTSPRGARAGARWRPGQHRDIGTDGAGGDAGASRTETGHGGHGAGRGQLGGEALQVVVAAGPTEHLVTRRSYSLGAAHQGLGQVRSECLTVDDRGTVHDLTIRSFGVVKAADTPHTTVTFLDGEANRLAGGPATAVPAAEAVMAAVAAATWHAAGGTRWPVTVTADEDINQP